MMKLSRRLKSLVALPSLCLALALPAHAQDSDALDDLFEALRTVDPADVQQIEQKIWREWSKSGSPAMDMLLDRGRDAMEAGDADAAIGHLSALIDHAPEFAEAYNARATVFFNIGRHGEALDDIRIALRLNPRHFGAMTGLAVIMEEIGRPELALRAWRAVEELSPNQQGVATSVGRLSRQVEGTRL